MTILCNFTIIILCFQAINHIDALKCYACGVANMLLESQYNSPLSCEDFKHSKPEDLQKFIVECPKDYLGCMAQLSGTTELRGCDTIPVEDCKIANGIAYCYCNSNLCNNQTMITVSKSEQIPNLNSGAGFIDDEDYEYSDMSGFGEADILISSTLNSTSERPFNNNWTWTEKTFYPDHRTDNPVKLSKASIQKNSIHQVFYVLILFVIILM